jgi:1-acyl-sn-glycerol-3-phosphate acyltransferase
VSIGLQQEVRERLERADVRFNRLGIDRFGIGRHHLALFLDALCFAYRHYFRVQVHGLEHVPRQGRAMLIGNHSGGLPLDGAMVIASVFLGLEPPRIVHGMVEKFFGRLPLASTWMNRAGQLTGLPEHARLLLEDERLLMVFPEGARGTAKLFPERDSLVQFGTGFVRLALESKAPIVPFAFVGGGEAIPTVANLYRLAKLLGVPYIPVTPYLLPLPLPVRLDIHYGEPLLLAGTGREEDHEIEGHVRDVQHAIVALRDRTLELRRRESPLGSLVDRAVRTVHRLAAERGRA